jgi:hypothetical protein
LCLLRHRTRAFQKMAGGHDVREDKHTQGKYKRYLEFKHNDKLIV